MTFEITNKRPDIPAPNECNFSGCARPSVYQVGFKVSANREQWPDAPPIRAVLGLSACEEHGKKIKPEDIVGDDGWRMIQDAHRKTHGPPDLDRSTIQVDLQPILKI